MGSESESESECVVFEGASFPTTMSSTSSSSRKLLLLGNGIYDTEIHYLQIKFYGIGVYAEADLGQHFKEWKGKSEGELTAEDSAFFPSFCKAPVEKLARLVIIKEVKGSQFVTPLQSSVRDRLAYADLYEEEEEEALDSLVEFFQKKAWLTQGSSIFLYWPTPSRLQVSVVVGNEVDGAGAGSWKVEVGNENVARGVQEWLFGPTSVSPSLLKSLASGVLRLL
ncbi:hypothetical protein GOP47_0022318 [Adiantum capillus-veneris]|uniref:Chalcone-flavonone isomerase family protein n=1 Tax=Adiantum capillus-veneris TaxID=13818 RepID=A0A9D4U950_ADICA|nr:hypothetical protein GOP47_0022318 [Adiantum capillus-veneris]